MTRKKKRSKILSFLYANKILVILVFALLLGASYLQVKSQSSVLGTRTVQFPIEETTGYKSTTKTPSPTLVPTTSYEVKYRQVTLEPTPQISLYSTPTPVPSQMPFRIPSQIPKPSRFFYMPTQAPNPTRYFYIPTSTPKSLLVPTPTLATANVPVPDYAAQIKKCLSDKENDPLNKMAELDREIYLNPNSTPEEKNAAIARLSTYNDIIGLKYDCYRSIPTALCNDGTYSYSQDKNGTCSYHNGVSQWFLSP